MAKQTVTQGGAPERSESASNHYLRMSVEDRAASALEMVQELMAQDNRLYCLASALSTPLTPPEGEDSADSVALGLAELLSELMADCSQSYRLLDCIEAMQLGAEEVRAMTIGAMKGGVQ